MFREARSIRGTLFLFVRPPYTERKHGKMILHSTQDLTCECAVEGPFE